MALRSGYQVSLFTVPSPLPLLGSGKGSRQLQQWHNEDGQGHNALFPLCHQVPNHTRWDERTLRRFTSGLVRTLPCSRREKQVSSPCGQSHTSFISSSCPQVQIVVGYSQVWGDQVNMPLRGGHALKRILPPKKNWWKPKPGHTGQQSKRTGLS